MSEFIWCEKVGQRRHFKVCQREKCVHLQGSGPDDYSCPFESAETKRQRKAKEKVAKKREAKGEKA